MKLTNILLANTIYANSLIPHWAQDTGIAHCLDNWTAHGDKCSPSSSMGFKLDCKGDHLVASADPALYKHASRIQVGRCTKDVDSLRYGWKINYNECGISSERKGSSTVFTATLQDSIMSEDGGSSGYRLYPDLILKCSVGAAATGGNPNIITVSDTYTSKQGETQFTGQYGSSGYGADISLEIENAEDITIGSPVYFHIKASATHRDLNLRINCCWIESLTLDNANVKIITRDNMGGIKTLAFLQTFVTHHTDISFAYGMLLHGYTRDVQFIGEGDEMTHQITCELQVYKDGENAPYIEDIPGGSNYHGPNSNNDKPTDPPTKFPRPTSDTNQQYYQPTTSKEQDKHDNTNYNRPTNENTPRPTQTHPLPEETLPAVVETTRPRTTPKPTTPKTTTRKTTTEEPTTVMSDTTTTGADRTTIKMTTTEQPVTERK